MIDIMVSTEKFYEDAKLCLEKKDLLDFMSNIGKAELLAMSETEFLPDVLFLKVRGLYKLYQYSKALEFVNDAEIHNSGNLEKLIYLNNFKGVMIGYRGGLVDARSIFKKYLSQIEDVNLLVETYLNVIWANLALYKIERKEKYFKEIKLFLDSSMKNFSEVRNDLKGLILDNQSVYYFYLGEIDKAIDIAKEAVQYFEEKDLPKIYNNLASICLKFNRDVDVLDEVRGYTRKAEIIATKYNDNLELGWAFYNQAMAELRADQVFTALDTLYLAFESLKKAEAMNLAFDCLIKINEIVNEYKIDRLKSLKDTLKEDFRGTELYKRL